MEMLISLHSYLAYAVLLILILAVANALKGWLTKKRQLFFRKRF